MAIGTILLYFAVVFALIAALVMERADRPPFGVNFGWLAFAFWLLSLVIK